MKNTTLSNIAKFRVPKKGPEEVALEAGLSRLRQA